MLPLRALWSLFEDPHCALHLLLHGHAQRHRRCISHQDACEEQHEEILPAMLQEALEN
jgi:hypothetical protein